MVSRIDWDPVQRCLESVELNARTKGHDSYNTLKNYRAALKQYLLFCNSDKGLEREATPRDLIEEALRDVRLTQLELRHTEFRKTMLKEIQELKRIVLDLIS